MAELYHWHATGLSRQVQDMSCWRGMIASGWENLNLYFMPVTRQEPALKQWGSDLGPWKSPLIPTADIT
jgi:hypothetical protein